MRGITIYFSMLLCSISVYSQNIANFNLPDFSKYVMCYTERENGSALKNTNVEFKNNSQCTGTCLFIWDFGDGSAQQISFEKKNGIHTYTTDGLFTVQLSVVNTASIHDSISTRIKKLSYIENSNDSVQLAIQYQASNNSLQNTIIQIPEQEFHTKALESPIRVFSPVVYGNNYTYEIDDPSTESHKAPIQSFVHIFTVDTNAFKTHQRDFWRYYWEIYVVNDMLEPTRIINAFSVDSIEYRYTFPAENINPGYLVRLKIALDSTKFGDNGFIDISGNLNYDLEECIYAVSELIPVSDYFFDEQTRNNPYPLSREIRIPNIFTPGGNDENDVFYINTNGVDEFSIWIYNSWGALVFKNQARTIIWTGKDNLGNDCPSGTYYYVIQSNIKDKRHESSGHIHLFRQN